MTYAQVMQANAEWGFNCGPAAICAALNMTPEGLRPRLGEFETRRYMNPTQVCQVLEELSQPVKLTYRSELPKIIPNVRHGIVRIQFGGRWMNAGVPKSARYRYTHWCVWNDLKVFDINAVTEDCNGWIYRVNWSNLMIGLARTYPGNDQSFWPTHVYEIIPDAD